MLQKNLVGYFVIVDYQNLSSHKLLNYLNSLTSANRVSQITALANSHNFKTEDLVIIYKYVAIYGISQLFFEVFARQPAIQVEIKSKIKPLDKKCSNYDPGQNSNGGHHENYNLFYANKANSENKKCQIWGNCLNEASENLMQKAEVKPLTFYPRSMETEEMISLYP